MAKKKEKKKWHLRMFFLGVTSIIIVTVITITIGKYWIAIYDKYQEKKKLEKEYVLLREKEQALKADANKLQDPDYIGRYAREKYLYSKSGEIILKIPDSDK